MIISKRQFQEPYACINPNMDRITRKPCLSVIQNRQDVESILQKVSFSGKRFWFVTDIFHKWNIQLSTSIFKMDLPWQQVKGWTVINTMLITIPFRQKPSFVRWYVAFHVCLPWRRLMYQQAQCLVVQQLVSKIVVIHGIHFGLMALCLNRESIPRITSS